MALRDEIQQIIDTELDRHPLTKLALEEGEDAVRDKVESGDLLTGIGHLTDLIFLTLGSHRLALLRLADEIDSLRTDL